MSAYARDVPCPKLEAKEAFEGLSAKEKMYAYHIAKASWEGTKICLFQTSYEAVPIFTLLHLMLGSMDSLEQLKTASGVDDDAWTDFLTYVTAFYGNMGNFKAFGDTKVIPAVSSEAFHSIIQASAAAKSHPALVSELWEAVREPMWSTDPVKEMGFPPSGTSGYYSANITKADAKAVQTYLDSKNISAYNTRVFKEPDGTLVVRQASAESSPEAATCESVNGTSIKVEPGDYSPLMARVVSALEQAKKHAANEHQESMLEYYITSFRTGSIEAFKDGSRAWIRDKGPAVESYIGFIESYRDPLGVRGEWEGFVAVVNRAMSEKFSTLVENAEGLLPLLPWPKEFEMDRFLRPDFTALEVVAFGSSHVPSGINIPNFQDIRQNEGFKNVSLSNVLSAALSTKSVSFLTSDDEKLYKELIKDAFEVQVGLHELLGHGSGKLLMESSKGELNFDPTTTVDPTTGKPIESYYKAGETWDSKFQALASTYEECKAECVGIYLCVNEKVLSIFGHEGEQAKDVWYVNWLNMCRAGLLALEFFRPENGTWGQAHMQGRFAILRVLLEAGQGLVSIVPHEEKGLVVQLDRSKVLTVGVPAIEGFLRKLQVYKSTADLDRGKAMYIDHYTNVPEDLLKLRDTVLAKKKERPIFVQPHLVLEGNDDVKLVEFAGSPEGLLESFKARYPVVDEEMLEIWRRDKESMLPCTSLTSTGHRPSAPRPK